MLSDSGSIPHSWQTKLVPNWECDDRHRRAALTVADWRKNHDAPANRFATTARFAGSFYRSKAKHKRSRVNSGFACWRKGAASGENAKAAAGRVPWCRPLLMRRRGQINQNQSRHLPRAKNSGSIKPARFVEVLRRQAVILMLPVVALQRHCLNAMNTAFVVDPIACESGNLIRADHWPTATTAFRRRTTLHPTAIRFRCWRAALAAKRR